MGAWIVRVLTTGGYPGLAMLAALECVFPPMPSELIFPLAGYLAQQGHFTVAGAIAAGAIGSTVGALPLYLLGRRLGADRVETFVERHCRWTAVTPEDLRRAHRWFERRGGTVVLLAHVVPALRSLIAIPAGVHRMPMPRFLAFTAAGAAAWTAALIGAGFVAGARFARLEAWLDTITTVALAAAAAWYVWRLFRARR